MSLLAFYRSLRECSDLVSGIVEYDRSDPERSGRLFREYRYDDTKAILSAIQEHGTPGRRIGNVLNELRKRDPAARRRSEVACRIEDAALYLLTALPYCLTFCLTLLFYVGREERVIYSQTRFGMGMSPFRVYKFTTMVTGAERISTEECLKKASDDPRILGKWGRLLRRTSLNELPQRRNLRCGELSVFGPRAYPARTHGRMLEMGAGRRNSIPPGWISLSHMVEYCRGISVEAIALLDVLYADLYETRYKCALDILAVVYMLKVILLARNR